MKKTLIVSLALVAVCAGAGAAAYQFFVKDDSVSVRQEAPKSREDYLALWQKELRKSGKELPAGTDRMSTQEIIDAWAREGAKHAQPG